MQEKSFLERAEILRTRTHYTSIIRKVSVTGNQVSVELDKTCFLTSG
jgi:hypothetical protein